MSTKAGGSDHLFLFTYGNHLLIQCTFRFNIDYVFIYLLKVMSTKAGGTDHPFLFTCFWIQQIPFVIFYGRILFRKIPLLGIKVKVFNGEVAHCEMQWPKRKMDFLATDAAQSKNYTFNVFLLYPQIAVISIQSILKLLLLCLGCAHFAVSCANSWRHDYLSHSNTMEVWKPARPKTGKNWPKWAHPWINQKLNLKWIWNW